MPYYKELAHDNLIVEELELACCPGPDDLYLEPDPEISGRPELDYRDEGCEVAPESSLAPCHDPP